MHIAVISLVVCLFGNFIYSARAQDTSPTSCKFDAGPSMTAVWDDPVLGNSGSYDPGDYEHRLDAEFGYVDCTGTRHVAPAGFVFNGASIPQALWSIGGYTPMSGKVQGPAVIHDYLCDQVAFTSDKVHKLFREGLLSTQTPKIHAATMYAGVKYFGPQWSEPGGEVTRPAWRQGLWDIIVEALQSASDIIISDILFYSEGPAASGYKMIELQRGTLNLDKVEEIDALLEKIDRLPDDVLHDLRQNNMSIKLDPQNKIAPDLDLNEQGSPKLKTWINRPQVPGGFAPGMTPQEFPKPESNRR